MVLSSQLLIFTLGPVRRKLEQCKKLQTLDIDSRNRNVNIVPKLRNTFETPKTQIIISKIRYIEKTAAVTPGEFSKFVFRKWGSKHKFASHIFTTLKPPPKIATVRLESRV